jgi:UDP-N-acetyl-D-glucosamine dehydrogenase
MDKVLDNLAQKIKDKKIEIAVVGLGYVGFPLALALAKKKVKVTGIEIDAGRLQSITQGNSYISDISSQELKKAKARGFFKASSSFADLESADAVLICVPTPLKRKYLPDISFIKHAVQHVAGHLKKGALVVLESTTYPGTTEEEILPVFEKRGFRHGEDFFLCFSPERIDPGNKHFPVHKIPKVMGGISPTATRLAMQVYRIILDHVVPVSNTRAAETVKLLENTFRLINIGLIDELSMMAHQMKIDIWEVITAASTKPFGFMPFYPGPGVGGHCIPKDPLYLHWKAKSFGFHSRFIKLASNVISYMPDYIVARVKSVLENKQIKLKQAKILVLGVTYKKDVKDLRKSPSLDVIKGLIKQGAQVCYADPLIPFLKLEGLNLKSVELTGKKIKEFDCCVVLTDHTQVDYARILRNAKFIFDSRNVYKGKYADKVERL